MRAFPAGRVLILVASVLCLGAARRPVAEEQNRVVAQFDVKVPMRDGVCLSTDIYRPADSLRHPVLLLRTPYDNYDPQTGYWYASRGYAVVLQDVRGKYDSQGQFYPYVNEAADGRDTQLWCQAQSWSNGRIGSLGASYVGATQVLPWLEDGAALSCMVPQMAAVDIYHRGRYDGGAFALAINATWGCLSATGRSVQNPLSRAFDWRSLLSGLPVGSLPERIGTRAPWFADWLAHPTYDRYWDSFSIAGKYERVKAPALNIGGWYDIFLHSTTEFFSQVSARGCSQSARDGQRLVIGPWTHGSLDVTRVGEVDFGPEAALDLNAEQLLWFDHWLKDAENRVSHEPRVRLFVMGENRWRWFDNWPPPGGDSLCLYLHSAGDAVSLLGNGRLDRSAPDGPERPDRYRYDPSDPAPTLGGTSSGLPELAPGGPYDQRPLERRADVLVYTSAPLENPLTVIGPLRLVLWVSSSVSNTDFMARLVDVHPDGRAINVSEGMLRAPLRHGFERWEELTPGQATELTVVLSPTANRFAAGHRLRLDITSSDFPRYDRNLNTPGADISLKTRLVIAEQSVLHGAATPSRLILSTIR